MARFDFSCWTYFSIRDLYPGFARDMRDLGFTVPLTPVFRDGDDPQAMLRLLDEFHSYGMQVYVFDDRVVSPRAAHLDEAAYRAAFARSLSQFGSHPAVRGFYVGDEPDAPEASTFFSAARIQKEMAPNLTPFLNLLPWFDWIGERIGSPAYGPYLDRAVKEGNLSLLAWDCYAQMWEGDSGYNDYFHNLKEMRDASLRHGVPFMNTVLSSGHYEYACPDKDAFRWQIATSAALGARAVCYFYICETPHENYRNFPINAFRERTEAFQWLSEENRYFMRRFGEIMPTLTIKKSEFTVKAYGGLGMFKKDDTLLSASNQKDVNMLVSTFRGEDGHTYRAVVNLDRKKNIEAHLTFAPGVTAQRRLFNGTWQTLTGPMDAVGALSQDGGVRMWMAPGQMDLIREA